MKLVTKKEAAAIKSVSLPAISQAIKRGSVVVSLAKPNLIDLDDPKNMAYFSKPKLRSLAQSKQADANKRDLKPSATFEDYMTYCEECQICEEDALPYQQWVLEHATDSMPSDVAREEELNSLQLEQVKVNIAYKKSQKEKLALAYAEKIGAIVDRQTLEMKFAPIVDVFLNELIPLPESLSDKLWNDAKDSDEPALSIQLNLQHAIRDVVRKLKSATQDLIPSDDAIIYSIELNND